jgi:hypothetical protein
MGVGGGTVRAHWETDEDDDTETVRVVVEAPPPPPPPPLKKATNGHVPAVSDSVDSSAAESDSPDLPAHDFLELQKRWSTLRSELASKRFEWTVLHSCELVGVEHRQLIVQLGSGNLKYIDDRDKKRAIVGVLIEMLGKGTDVRFIDDKAPYTPPAAAPGAAPAAASTATAAPPLPTSDPVIQAGLRLFGGPLERVPDE